MKRLLKMFFAHKMTREFAEAYEEAFKDDYEHNQAKSKELIKELKDIFQDNLQALYIVVIRLHFKGMILVDDVEEMIKGEFFREKICFHFCQYIEEIFCGADSCETLWQCMISHVC